MQEIMATAQAFIQAAALSPDPVSLGLVVLLIGVLPLSAVVPMTGLCLAASAVLAKSVAVPVTMAGILLNTGLAWGLARTVFGARFEAWLERRGGALGAVREGARRQPLKWAILVRFIPAPFMAGPMILASTGVSLGKTLLGSFIAMAPWCLAYAWLASAGRQGDLKSLGLAMAGLAALVVLGGVVRKKMLKKPPLPALQPRRTGGPLLLLYTLPGQDLSDEAREELAALRDELGYEVQETVLGPGAPAEDLRAYTDHAPVALFDGHKLFNFKMDENVLRVRLKEWRLRHTGSSGEGGTRQGEA